MKVLKFSKAVVSNVLPNEFCDLREVEPVHVRGVIVYILVGVVVVPIRGSVGAGEKLLGPILTAFQNLKPVPV